MDDVSMSSRAPEPSGSSAMPAVDNGDDSDWEYEYSTTETETHLVTLDLSVPEFLRRREDYVVHNTRGGFRAWMNPLLAGDDDVPVERREPGGSLDDGAAAAPATAHGSRNGHAASDDSDPEIGDPNDAENSAKNNDDDAAEAARIQILDLHAAQPILSYRGTVFAGVWTETVGTEMLFADAKSSASSAKTPLVRRLPHDVDLLGASSARIVCTPVELRRRKAKAPLPTAPASSTPRRQFAIPVAGGATEQRQRQAAFLERLMAAKHGRGERDVVTVQAVETRQDTVQNDVEEERLRRKKAAQFERYRLRASRRRRGEDSLGVGVGVGAVDGVEVRVRTEAATTTEAMVTTDTPTEPRIRTPARHRKKPRASVAQVSRGIGRGQDSESGG